MKKLLLLLSGVLLALPGFAHDFTYTYEGQTITYIVLDEDAKTCRTNYGSTSALPGNSVSGDLVLPAHPMDGETEYTLTEIGLYAFSGCTSLTSVVIPNSVTEIRSNAFTGCSSLTSVDIPTSVTIIPWDAFRDCSALTSIEIPNSVTEIGGSAFSGCSSLTSVNLPTSLTKIGGSAFDNCTSLTSIEIPNSVTEIEGHLFYGCSSLTSIDIPNSVTQIGDFAFRDCSALTSIEIPNSVTEIGGSAFSGCSALISIEIPNSVTQIGESVFSKCTSLTSIEIPYFVTEIGRYAFSGCSSLTSVDIPNSVTQIGEHVFYNCKSLISIEIPNFVTEIGRYAFSGCSALTSIKIPNTVTQIGENAFEYCSALTSIELPSSVTKIGDYAFDRCSSLTSIDIPNSVTEIGDYAFSGCYFSSVAIPGSVTKLGRYVFGCNKIAYPNTINIDISVFELVYDPETCIVENGCVWSKDKKKLYFASSGDENFAIPEGVTTIGENAFAYCNFDTLTIPSTIEVVEKNAFPYAESSVTFPNPITCSFKRVNFSDWSKWCANAKLENIYSVPYLNSEAFAGGVKCKPVELKEGLEEIPDYINYGLYYDGEIILPSTLKRIGAFAFFENKEIYKVYMSAGLEEIGDYAFAGCELLENVEFPGSLVSIGDGAFAECNSFTEITLPEGLKSLGSEEPQSYSDNISFSCSGGVFESCKALEKAVLLSECEYLGKYTFRYCPKLNKVYLPLKLQRIGEYAFHNCQLLDEITLPASLESIGAWAFGYGNSHQDGYGLSALTVPDNVKYIGESAFENQGISRLKLGAGLTSVSSRAFYGNPLKMVEFSEGLEGIDEYAFANYYGSSQSISLVKLPSSLKTIKNGAFYGTRIAEMIIPDGVSDLPGGSCGTPSLLTIGSGVKTMSGSAFQFDNLTSLRVKTIAPPTLDAAFNITDAQNDRLTLVVNNGRKTAFSTNARWKQIDEIIEEESTDVTVYLTGEYALSEEIRTTTGLMPASVARLKVVGPLSATDLRVIKENMVSLRSLDLSEVTGLTEIPDNQFKGSLLTDIKLPSTITTVGIGAFSNCPLLTMEELPEGITTLYRGAFSGSPRVSFTSMPSTISYIGEECFRSCTSIRSMTLPESLEALGYSAFSGCSLLEVCDMSRTALTEVRTSTFSHCTSLEEVILPETVKTIENDAFRHTALRDIEFAANVNSIGTGAFRDCRRLVTANLPKGVTEVESSVLSNCPRLVAVSMSAGMKNIGSKVFNGDSKLANISCAAADAPVAASDAFDNIRDRYVSLTVPGVKYREYLNAPQWGKFRSIQNRLPLEIEDGVDVSGVAEDDYQDMLKEDALEEAVKASQEASEVPSRSVASRAASSAKSSTRNFASLFDGAQMFTGNEGSGTRIFITPKDGVEVTSIKLNGKEMLSELQADNSLLIPARSAGGLVIKTSEGKSGVSNIAAPEFDGPTEVFNLNGVKVADSTDGLAPGLYIVRQGSKVTKIAVK